MFFVSIFYEVWWEDVVSICDDGVFLCVYIQVTLSMSNVCYGDPLFDFMFYLEEYTFFIGMRFWAMKSSHIFQCCCEISGICGHVYLLLVELCAFVINRFLLLLSSVVISERYSNLRYIWQLLNMVNCGFVGLVDLYRSMMGLSFFLFLMINLL